MPWANTLPTSTTLKLRFLQLLMFYTAKAHKAIAIAQMPKYMYVYVGLSPCRIICVHVWFQVRCDALRCSASSLHCAAEMFVWPENSGLKCGARFDVSLIWLVKRGILHFEVLPDAVQTQLPKCMCVCMCRTWAVVGLWMSSQTYKKVM